MDVLNRVYWRVSNLQDFLTGLNGCPTLITSKDKAGYKAFLQSTLVGIPSCYSNYQGPLDYKQYSDHTEVINRVMLRLQRQGKSGKNVLLNGFNSWRSDDGSCGIPSNIPNNNSNQLRIPYWCKLLSRIGDELMMHILENLSIFTSAPPSCYIQLTGTPVMMLTATIPSCIPSPTKQGRMNERSDQKKSCQFKDARGGNDEDESHVVGPSDKEESVVCHKRKRDEVDGNDADVVAKTRKTEKGTCQRMQSISRLRREAMNSVKTTKDHKFVEEMVTGLERSYCILNACYSRTVGWTWPKQNIMSNLPASNSGAQKLTQHIFQSEHSYRTQSKNIKIPNLDANVKKGVDRQGEDKGKRKKKPQRTCNRLIKVQALLKTFLVQHRKIKLRSILDHQCPLKIPQEDSIPDQTYNIQQDSSKRKPGQRSQGRKMSLALSSHSNSMPQKSLAELKEESMLEGYSPVVFQRGKHKLCGSSSAPTSSNLVTQNELVTGVDEIGGVEKGTREVLCDRRGAGRTNETLKDGRKVRRMERGKSTDVNSRSKMRMRLPSDAANLIKMRTEPCEVYLFLRQVLLKVVPDKLWGSMHNRNVFLKGVKKFVQLGHYERLSLKELIEEIRLDDCDWCQLEKFKGRQPPFTSVVKQRQLVTDFFHWLMNGYTIPLIMMCFYVTETSSSRNQLVFYRKPVWLQLEKFGIQYYVASGIMKPIKESEARKLVASGLTLGFSRLRFVPKVKSLRPITRMGKSVIVEKKGLSVRLLLQDLFDVLTYHKIHQPSLLGCSLLGIDGIYDMVLRFIQNRKARQDTRPLFFVKIDIEKCYDSIKQSKLLQIISMLLQGHDKPDEYQIHRYIIVTKSASGGLKKINQRHVTTKLNLAASFHRQLMQMTQSGEIKNAIIINQVHTVKVTPVALLERLKQHVMADVVKSGRKYYWRQNGISQGSILSSLLCSFFYAHLERCYLSDIDQEGLMMRLIDDFILITPHLDKAQRFLQLLLSGVKQYGCSANPNKTLVNFDYMFDGQLVPTSTELFPWCGIIFNTQTLNISNDYSKYNNVSIRYTLTLCTDKDTSLRNMRTKLMWSLKAKNVSIFMDPQINCFRTIVINVYRLLLLLAYRFHSYHHCLPSFIKQNTSPLQFYYIWASCVKSFHATVSKFQQSNPSKDTFPLTMNTVNWISLKAFDTKLSKHKGIYHPLIKLIRKHRRKAANKMGKAMQEVLEDMTNPAMPEDFMKMRR